MYRRVSAVVNSDEEVELALDMLRERIKDELWKEVWRDMVEIGGEGVVERRSDGKIKVTVIYDDTKGNE